MGGLFGVVGQTSYLSLPTWVEVECDNFKSAGIMYVGSVIILNIMWHNYNYISLKTTQITIQIITMH